MGFYSKYILPSFINIACQINSIKKQREKVIPLAQGNVLEIGVGSGLNLPFYDKSKIIKLTAIDPSEDLWHTVAVDLKTIPFEFEFIKASAEDLPFPDQSFDTVVATYTLCTIPDAHKALLEMRRVLKKDGVLIFCEHGKAPNERTIKVQQILNPLWKQLAGGCNLDRDIPKIIENSGFKIQDLKEMYIPGWRPACYNYWGTAT